MNFPNEYFPIDKSLIDDFNMKLQYGEHFAKKLNVLFCATCKDVEKTIKKVFLFVDNAGKMFNSYSIFLYENNSSDATVETIKSLNHNLLTLETEFIEGASYTRDEIGLFKRCERIANARNKYVKHVNENIAKYDYIFVFDTDIQGGWSNEGILNSIYYLETNRTFGCMSSYCVLASAQLADLEDVDSDKWLMFDSFAFRNYNSSFPNDRVSWLKALNSFNYIKVKRGTLPIFVDSNFNGLAIYRPECFIDNSYGVKNYGDDIMTDCDHVVFNREIRNKGMKILMNPSMITSISNHKYSKGLN